MMGEPVEQRTGESRNKISNWTKQVTYLTWSSPAMRLLSALTLVQCFFANALINGL